MLEEKRQNNSLSINFKVFCQKENIRKIFPYTFSELPQLKMKSETFPNLASPLITRTKAGKVLVKPRISHEHLHNEFGASILTTQGTIVNQHPPERLETFVNGLDG